MGNDVIKLAQQTFSYRSTWKSQLNYTPLPPPERFAIGGRHSVRGFDPQHPLPLTADRGWLLRQELGLPLGSSGQTLYLGIDYGGVGGSNSEFIDGGKWLAGGLIGWRGQFQGFSYDLFIGKPFKKPKGFTRAHSVTGFSLTYQI